MNAPESRLATAAIRTDREWLDAHWMPYCANRAFKADPHIFVAAEGAWLTTHEKIDVLISAPQLRGYDTGSPVEPDVKSTTAG